MDEESAVLLRRWSAGDEDAATALFHRFARPLIALANQNLSPQLAREVSGEDVVQSVFRSFFKAVEGGRYLDLKPGDLWALLARITLNKLRDKARAKDASKRGGGRSPVTLPEVIPAQEPSPSEAFVLAELLAEVLQGLPVEHRRILELWLEGQGWDPIAREMDCSQRTVRRVLEKLETQLQARLHQGSVT